MKHLHGKYFLHGLLEPQERHGLASANVHSPHSAYPFLQVLCEGKSDEECGVPDLGQPDEGQVSAEIHSPGEPGQLGHGLQPDILNVGYGETPLPGLQDP